MQVCWFKSNSHIYILFPPCEKQTWESLFACHFVVPAVSSNQIFPISMYTSFNIVNINGIKIAHNSSKRNKGNKPPVTAAKISYIQLDDSDNNGIKKKSVAKCIPLGFCLVKESELPPLGGTHSLCFCISHDSGHSSCLE